MKTYILSLVFVLLSFICFAQDSYIVNGETYELLKETNGTIELLWNKIDGYYRYFVKKDNKIIELVNTKDEDENYKQDYKVVLTELTSDKNLSTKKINLTLISLKQFIDEYNALKDPEYTVESKAKLLTRLSVFGGITNSPFVINTDNIKNPVFGVEFEFSEDVELPRHSIFFQGKKVVSSDSFDYSTAQIIVGYRFRIINKRAFNIYANLDIAEYKYVKNITSVFDEDVIIVTEDKENGFEAPFTFGIGADIRISDHSFISLTYNELFSIILENEGNFSTSFAIGYKFKL